MLGDGCANMRVNMEMVLGNIGLVMMNMHIHALGDGCANMRANMEVLMAG